MDALRNDHTRSHYNESTNPVTPRVKPWVIQHLTFDSIDRTLKCDHSYYDAVFFFNFPQFVILENLIIFGFGIIRSERVKTVHLHV